MASVSASIPFGLIAFDDVTRQRSTTRRPSFAMNLGALCRTASWADFTDLRQDFRTADLYGNCTIFDIRRNEFRIITWVNYKRQRVFVRAFLTHADAVLAASLRVH